jgi:hypothetical protein
MPDHLWAEILQRPKIIPNPMINPASKRTVNGKPLFEYLNYEQIKYKNTTEEDRPSYKPPDVSKAMKDYDKKVSSETKPSHLTKNATLWNRSYVRATICCNTCNKPRLIFAYTRKGEDVGQVMPLLKSFLEEPGYEYICGDSIFGLEDNPVPHQKELDIFHVRRAINCSDPVESIYYSTGKFPAVCAHCGREDGHVSVQEVEEITSGCKAYTICRTCLDNGKKPVTYGQGLKAQRNKRSRGNAHLLVTKPASKPAPTMNTESPPLKRPKPDAGGIASFFVAAVSSTTATPTVTAVSPSTTVSLVAAVSPANTLSAVPADYSASSTAMVALVSPTTTLSAVAADYSTPSTAMVAAVASTSRTCPLVHVPLWSNVSNEEYKKLLAPFNLSETSLKTIFDIVNVKGDGNCCLYSAMKFLFETGKEMPMSVTEFRKMLYHYVLEHKDYFQEPKTNPEFARFLTKTQWDELVRSLWIAERAANYDRGCAKEQWVDMGVFAPILAYKYNIDVAVISPDNQSLTTFENGVLSAGKKGWIRSLAFDLLNSNRMNSTLVVLYHNDHYYWLKTKAAEILY